MVVTLTGLFCRSHLQGRHCMFLSVPQLSFQPHRTIWCKWPWFFPQDTVHMRTSLITTDFLNKKRVVNKGIVPQYYVEGSHEAIIPRELFMQVQEEMVRRASLETGTGKRRVYSGKYALSHRVYCAHCGDIFQRTQWFIRGECLQVWRCISRLARKKCGIDCGCDSFQPDACSEG